MQALQLRGSNLLDYSLWLSLTLRCPGATIAFENIFLNYFVLVIQGIYHKGRRESLILSISTGKVMYLFCCPSAPQW